MLAQIKTLLGLLVEARHRPFITIGFSLFWVWVWLVAQASFLYTNVLALPQGGLSPWIVPMSAYGVTFLFMGVLYALKRVAPKSTGYKIAVGAFTSVGAFTCITFALYPTTNIYVTGGLMIVGGILAGSGTACMHIQWGRQMGTLGTRKTVVHATLGTLGAMLLIFLYSKLPLEIAWLALIILPLACMFSLILHQRKIDPAEEHKQVERIFLPWRFLKTSFIQGAAFGIFQSILAAVEKTQDASIISVGGSVLGALLVFAVVFLFKLDFNQLIYHVGFVLLALSFALMVVFSESFSGAWLINATGYRFIDILMWTLCVHLIKHRGLPANWVFAITTCALILGQSFGALCAEVVQILYDFDGHGLIALSVMMLFVILAGALFMSSKQNLKQGWGMIRPYENDDQRGSFEAACVLAADGFGLTARELEIFIRLARGERKSLIADELVLAPETIKTHTRNIYRKSQLHSHDEIIKLVQSHIVDKQ